MIPSGTNSDSNKSVYINTWLKSKFDGRNHNLVDRYEMSVSLMAIDLFVLT